MVYGEHGAGREPNSRGVAVKTIIRNLFVAAVVALGIGGVSSLAQACDHCPPVYRYETIVTYEYRQVPYTVCETRYDECGRAYTVTVTRYRTVRVAVTRQVLVRVS